MNSAAKWEGNLAADDSNEWMVMRRGSTIFERWRRR
jgi:hypothetical protein